LPPKIQNDSLSKGFVSFRVLPKTGLTIGDSLRNKAAIYFDYNFPVITNSVKTMIAANILTPVSNIQYNSNKLKNFPNPIWNSSLQLKFSGNYAEKI
jgi:hypothetical protein